jgi:hypothetical protein
MMAVIAMIEQVGGGSFPGRVLVVVPPGEVPEILGNSPAVRND